MLWALVAAAAAMEPALEELVTAATKVVPVGTVVGATADGWWVAMEASTPLRPGSTVTVYRVSSRPDPRGGAREGLGLVGPGALAWVGGDLLELQLARPLALGQRLQLVALAPGVTQPTWTPVQPQALATGSSLAIAASPSVSSPSPPEDDASPSAPADTSASAPAEQLAPAPHHPSRSSSLLPRHPFGQDLAGRALGSVHDHPRYSGQAIALQLRYSGDGYGSGAGLGGFRWRLRPDRGPARVELGLEGLRGRRWTASLNDGEPDSTELAAGYWLWSRVDSAGLGVGVFGGLGLGVDDSGLAPGVLLGLRSGHLDRSYVAASWEGRGQLGGQLTLEGRLALSDALRLGPRARVGDLPRNKGGRFVQARAEGALVLALDPAPAWTLTLAAGAAGYRLLAADAGPALGGELETRW